MAKKKVYIETSIVSYLTARPSRDLLAAAWPNGMGTLKYAHLKN